MDLKWELHKFNFNPTLAQLQTVGPTVYHVMGVKRGTWVRFVAVRLGVGFDGTTPVLVVGDDAAGGGDVDGFLAEADIADISVAGLYPGWGLYFSGANGKLYTTNDTIDLLYTGVGGDGGFEVTEGSAIVYVVYAELE